MSDENLPRWGLPKVEFIETDPDKIQAEIINGFESVSGRSLASGDPVRLFLLSVADMIIKLRVAFNIGAQQNLLSYATGDKLDALGQYMNVPRLAESFAKTTIRFTLTQSLGNDYVIPANFEITNGVITFATDSELVIPAGQITGEMSATCTQSGVAGNNYLAGQISTIVRPITFLSKAENITITTGGSDSESDPEYAERIRIAPNSFSVAGPAKAYEYYTYSVSSAIIDVSVTSPEPGVVKIFPLLEDGTLPSAEVLDQIKTYLSGDDIRPLTDVIEVSAPTAKNYNIKVEYWISRDQSTNAESIRAAVDEAVEKYRLWQQAKIGRDITPDQLICNVMGAGAARVDFSTLSPANWLELKVDEVAQCAKENVTIVYKGIKDD